MKKSYSQIKSMKYNKNHQKNLNSNIKQTKKIHEIVYKIDTSKITGTCPICLNHTFDDPSNLIVEENIFHFDCVVQWIKSKFEIQENNKILYIGSNTFGIFWESRSQKLELLKKINILEELKEYVKNTS